MCIQVIAIKHAHHERWFGTKETPQFTTFTELEDWLQEPNQIGYTSVEVVLLPEASR